MDYEHILVDVEDGVAIVTLNRPAQLNAMNRKLGRELHDAVKQAEADDAIGCIVITVPAIVHSRQAATSRSNWRTTRSIRTQSWMRCATGGAATTSVRAPSRRSA